MVNIPKIPSLENCMRFNGLIILLLSAGFALAQSQDKSTHESITNKQSPPESVELLAQAKAPKPDANEVNVIIKKNQIVEEYRQKGELIMVKVIPADGVPYYIDPQAKNMRTGAYSDLINSGVEPVHWVIKRF